MEIDVYFTLSGKDGTEYLIYVGEDCYDITQFRKFIATIPREETILKRKCNTALENIASLEEASYGK